MISLLVFFDKSSGGEGPPPGDFHSLWLLKPDNSIHFVCYKDLTPYKYVYIWRVDIHETTALFGTAPLH